MIRRAASVAIAGAALWGCASNGPKGGEDPAFRASVVGERDGLEVRWWVVEDRGQSLAGALAPMVDRASPISELRADALRQSGLRLIAVSAREAEAIHDELPTVGADVRQWMGELSSWTEVVKGPELGAVPSVRTSEGATPIQPGRMRMLARCYRLPGGSRDGGVPIRVELMPQLELRSDLASDVRLALGEASGLEAAGPVFESQAVSWIAQPGMVYLLVPEAPGADWRSIALAPRAESALDVLEAPESESDLVGPSPVSAPTLGEALLASPDAWPGISGRRAIVVLAPVASDRRELIPD